VMAAGFAQVILGVALLTVTVVVVVAGALVKLGARLSNSPIAAADCSRGGV
jgi:hypothetical protein